ncbi:MAG TPA: condensation domain-containing protein, partial [Pyrinomonadaceae bacterium]|nr:condensation domain-containing protein [Pyrinomonadaceae bacterium]
MSSQDQTDLLKNLSPAKRALLLKALSEEKSRADASKAIPRRTQEGPAPLSYAQRRLWFLSQLGADPALYNMASAVRLRGALDVEALRSALRRISERHESLRTSFAAGADGEPVQVVEPDAELGLEVLDIGGGEERARAVAREMAREGFDLGRAPLARARLLRLGGDEHVLVVVMHHIISDGWSTGVLVGELVRLYAAYSEGGEEEAREAVRALPVQYPDFAVWQNRWLESGAMESQLAYWKNQLAGAATVLQLPTDHERPAKQTHRGAQVALALSPDLTSSVKRLAREHSATPFMLLLSAFYVLLRRYTSQPDILVGTPVANRTRPEIEPLIGFFVNTLVLRADLSDDPSFLELLKRVKRTALDAYANQDLPFEKLVEVLNPARDMSRSAMFQVMFVQQEEPASGLRLAGLEVETLDVGTGTAKFEQTWAVREVGGGDLELRLEYNADLFDSETAKRMARHYRNLLEAAVGEPRARCSELPLMGEGERRLLLEGFNDT